jgi:hypothetical protein
VAGVIVSLLFTGPDGLAGVRGLLIALDRVLGDPEVQIKTTVAATALLQRGVECAIMSEISRDELLTAIGELYDLCAREVPARDRARS